MSSSNAVIGFIILWLAVVTFFLYKIKAHYNNLVSRTKKGKIDDILDSLLEKDVLFKEEIDKLKKTAEEIIYQNKFHFQKMGFLRFNPFDRVGGKESFVIAILNKEDSGIILNFLYTREGIRVYAKKIEKGICEEYELSTEEKEVIKKAH